MLLVAEGPPKRCNGCSEVKLRSEFYARRTQHGIYAQSLCKACLRTKYDHAVYDVARRARLKQDPELLAIYRERQRESKRRARGSKPKNYRSLKTVRSSPRSRDGLVSAAPFVMWLRDVMRRDGLTIMDLAARCGVSDRTLRAFLCGERSSVRVATVDCALVADGDVMLRDLYPGLYGDD